MTSRHVSLPKPYTTCMVYVMCVVLPHRVLIPIHGMIGVDHFLPSTLVVGSIIHFLTSLLSKARTLFAPVCKGTDVYARPAFHEHFYPPSIIKDSHWMARIGSEIGTCM